MTMYTVLDTNSRAPRRLPCVENLGMNGLDGGVSSTVGKGGIDGAKVFFTGIWGKIIR